MGVVYKKCPSCGSRSVILCGLDINDLLVSTHIKPWTKSNYFAKQDKNIGILL